MSDELRVSIIARRENIEQMKEGVYAEAQQQFEAALKLDRSNSWVYTTGLLFLEQRRHSVLQLRCLTTWHIEAFD